MYDFGFIVKDANFLVCSMVDVTGSTVQGKLSSDCLQLPTQPAVDCTTQSLSMDVSSRFFRWNTLFGLSSGNPFQGRKLKMTGRDSDGFSSDSESSFSSSCTSSSVSDSESDESDTKDCGADGCSELEASIL